MICVAQLSNYFLLSEERTITFLFVGNVGCWNQKDTGNLVESISGGVSMIKFHALQREAVEDWQHKTPLEICYDGGARSGKTWYICFAIIQRALRNPGSRHLISRLRGNHLEVSVWRQTLLPLLKEIARGHYRIDKVYRTITFHNGSEIMGLALEDIDRIQKIMGTEFSTVFINEATQISWATYQTIKTRCVQNIDGLLNKVIVDCNPANQYHWIYKYFIQSLNPDSGDPIDSDRIKRRGPWLPTDNPHLSDTGLEIIDSLIGAQHDRLARGLWVTVEGLVYPDYEESIIDPFEIPYGWEVTCAVDFGYSNPFVFLWFAQDLSNEVYYLFDEYLQTEKTVSTHCAYLKTYKSKWMDNIKADWIVADHDAEDRATMRQEGFPTRPADKDIRTGVQSVQRLMSGQKGWQLKIFRTCTNTIGEFSSYKWPELKRGDDRDEKPVKQNDHCFTADTEILTKEGYKRIAALMPTDILWTPFGWSRILRIGSNGNKEVFDYGVFRCTKDHKIPTNKGIKEISCINERDLVMVWGLPRGWSLMEFLIGVIRIHPTEIWHFIIGGLRIKNLAAKQDFYTGMYGNTIRVKFLTRWWSIISMVIPAIMISIIWLLYHARNMLLFMKRNVVRIFLLILKGSGHLQKNGIEVKKAGSGINNMQDGLLRKCGPDMSQKNALFVARNTKRIFLQEANTVIKIAEPLPCGEEEVFNLATEHGFYLANGILVANCMDSLRYWSKQVIQPVAAKSFGSLKTRYA